ncbi:MAG: NYN domain-containing protein [Planctomycetota bacterium]|jgi:uncharacterized LabA/DUF88 family protein
MDAAVFVDFENLYLSLKNHDDCTGLRTRELSLQILQGLLIRLRERGHNKVIGRSYAAFDTYPGVEVAHDLALMGLDPQYVLISHSGKNSADIQLSLDAAKVVFRRPDIELIVIVSGDRDFIPLAGQVLEEGRELRVVSIPDTTSGDLRDRVGEERFVDALQLIGERSALLKKPREPIAANGHEDAEAPVAIEPAESAESAAAEVVEEEAQTCQDGPRIVGHIPVTWERSGDRGSGERESLLTECLELMVRARMRHSSEDIWLSPFLKGPMSQHFNGLIHPERRALINELRNRNVVRVEERANQHADHPYSVIVIEDSHPMAQAVCARLQRH